MTAVTETYRRGVYPLAPMPGEMRRAWRAPGGAELERAEAAWREQEAAVQRARELALSAADRPTLRYEVAGPLVSLSGKVSGSLSERKSEVRREQRRLRFRMRAAAQRVVQVSTRVRHPEPVYDAATGALVQAAGGVRRERLGQKLCGRGTGMELPSKGSSVGSKIERTPIISESGNKLLPDVRPGRAQTVDVVARPGGGAELRNIYRCGSVWCCPVCSYYIASERGKELHRVHAHLQEQGAVSWMVTLTVRHWKGMGLAELRKAVATAWKKLRGTRAYRAHAAALGYIGDVRALEVTHGPNGWHPHLHVLAFFRPPAGRAGARAAARARSWLRGAWADAIQAATGARPDRTHGVHAQRVHKRADYVAKLGIAAELTSAQSKEGREGHRTTWEILRDLADYHRPADEKLWREWSYGIHGARQLTWTKELRELRAQLGIQELSDEEAAALVDEEPAALVASIPLPTWSRLEAKLPGFALWVVESAERWGGEWLVRDIEELDRTLLELNGPPPWWRGWAGKSPPVRT